MTRRYLPWWRTGAATLLSTPDGPGLASRPTLPIGAWVAADPSRTASVTARLYGPGEVTGVDQLQVIRTEPAPGATDFEPNYFCTVEFDAPELPWMFTPAAANAAGQLRPWLVLVVVRRAGGELDRRPGRPLPVLSTDPSAELPDLAQSWAWAHVQLTGDGAPLDILRGDPARTLSRLVCPRRLQPATRYLAAVVPAFQQGVQAGLGLDVDPGDLAPAWQPADTAVELPVYHSWEFGTGPAGDFENLVTRLEPYQVAAGELAGLPVELPAQPAGVPAGGTMHVPAALGTGDQTPAPVPGAVSTRLAALLDLAGGPVHPDLPVALPGYGRWHAGRRAGAQLSGTGWFPDLVLHPAARLVAALGTRVVQQRQEELMAAAWAQVGPIARANRLLGQGQLARDAGSGLWRRHLDPLPDAALLAVAAPAGSRLVGGGGQTVAAEVAASRVPDALLTGAARRTLRARGPLGRAGGVRRAVAVGALVERGNERGDPASGRLAVGEPEVRPAGMVSVDDLHRRFDLPRWCGLGPEWWGRLPPPTGPHVPPLRKALITHSLGRGPCAPAAPRPRLPVGDLAKALRAGLDPRAAVTAAVRGRLTLPAGWAPDDPLEPVLAAPDFPAPMYREVAELAPDLLLPGVNRLPLNSVTGLGSNPWFVQAFLVGLNHEMARELLWRGYPTDQRGTCFRRFWDRAAAVPPKTGAAADDITPIPDWGPAADLGVAGAVAGGGAQLVLAVRGDVLRRYPRTVVYLARAEWTGDTDANGDPVPGLAAGGAEKHAEFGGSLPPDVTFLGFDLSPEDARGTAGDPGWYVVFAEPPTEPRLGLDETAPAVPTGTWADLSWAAVQVSATGHVTLGTADPALTVDPAKDPRGLHFSTAATSAQVAAAAEQRPFRVALHARRLLPGGTTP
ncbi:MAG: hypothetical protein ACJ73E_18930 [Mycobacteriales bacterium]